MGRIARKDRVAVQGRIAQGTAIMDVIELGVGKFSENPFLPELLDELRQTLDIMETDFLSPALRTTKKNLLKNMNNKP